LVANQLIFGGRFSSTLIDLRQRHLSGAFEGMTSEFSIAADLPRKIVLASGCSRRETDARPERLAHNPLTGVNEFTPRVSRQS
jgi:hypothetical protein